jgi:hypothetical protein
MFLELFYVFHTIQSRIARVIRILGLPVDEISHVNMCVPAITHRSTTDNILRIILGFYFNTIRNG